MLICVDHSVRRNSLSANSSLVGWIVVILLLFVPSIGCCRIARTVCHCLPQRTQPPVRAEHWLVPHCTHGLPQRTEPRWATMSSINRQFMKTQIEPGIFLKDYLSCWK